MKQRGPELRPLCKRHAHRGGFTLIECLGAFAVLSGTLVVLLLALGMLRQSERSFNQRQLGLESAANLLAEAAVVPYAELNSGRAKELASAAELNLAEQLPGAIASLEVRDNPSATPPHKRLQARIVWNSPGGQTTKVSLERVRFAAVREAKP